MVATVESIRELIADGSAYVRLRPFLAERQTEPEEILLENRIWMPSVRTQDDIYEGDPSFRWSEAPVTREKVEELARRNMQGVPLDQLNRQVELILERMRDPALVAEMRTHIERELRDLYRSSSILSFFKDPTLQSYWANYADRGRGYGLIYDFRDPWQIEIAPGLGEIPSVPFEVNYVPADEQPRIELEFGPTDPDSAFEDLKAGLLTKSDEWIAQREERLIRSGIPAGHVQFPPKSLKAVVIGYGVSEDNAERLRVTLGRRDIALLALKVIRVDGSYRLGIEAA